MRNIGIRILSFVVVSLSIAMVGCASIRSSSLPENDSKKAKQGGIVYYMPMQRLKLTLTVAVDTKDKQQVTRTVEISTTPTFADTNERFVAQYRRNQIGSNMLKVSANVDGLLSGDASGSTSPQIAAFLGSIASGTRNVMALSMPTESVLGCTSPGVYEWVFDVPPAGKLPDGMLACGLNIEANSLGTAPLRQKWKSVNRHTQGPGYFYRQKHPVEVTISSGKQHKVFYFSMVDKQSPIEFLPIPRTVFADTTWKVTFTEGSPTVYDVNAGGDALGLVKLPADVLKAYSQSLLAGLNEKKDVAGAETQYLQQLNALAAQQAKYELCRTAVQSGDSDKIKAACQ